MTNKNWRGSKLLLIKIDRVSYKNTFFKILIMNKSKNIYNYALISFNIFFDFILMFNLLEQS